MEKSWQQCRGSKPLGVRSESVTGCHFPNGGGVHGRMFLSTGSAVRGECRLIWPWSP